MLVLTRKAGEQIVLGDDITITLLEVRGGEVRIGVDAPSSVAIHRAEVLEAISSANLRAADASDEDAARIGALLTQRNDAEGAPPAGTEGTDRPGEDG